MAWDGVLVVEDDALVSWALEKAAAALHVPVHVAATGSEALESVRNHRIGLAFVDVRLPDADGVELLSDIRALAPGVRVVVMTSDATTTNRERALRNGAWHFLEKPFELAEVSEVIRTFYSAAPEHRGAPRHLCALPLRLELPGGADGTERIWFEGLAVESSVGGLRIETAYPVTPGQRLRVHLVPANERTEAERMRDTEARVVWTRRSPTGVTAGLAYLEPDAPFIPGRTS